MSILGRDVQSIAISRSAHHVRARIESFDRTKLPDEFRDFPKGACEYSSLLLKLYLENNGITGFELYCGPVDNSPEMHAWLQRETLVVDITCDQFADFREPVFVMENSPWHAGLRPQQYCLPISTECLLTFNMIFENRVAKRGAEYCCRKGQGSGVRLYKEK